MTRERNNLKAGLFVVAGIVLALVFIFTLSDVGRLLEPKQRVQVYFPLHVGLHGLKVGATVTLGDTPIGEVIAVEDAAEDGTGRVVGATVTVSIPKRYAISQDAIVELRSPPLGSGTKLNIRSVGAGPAYDGVNPLPGVKATSALMSELAHKAGIEDEQRRQVQQIIADVAETTAHLREDLPQITGSVRRVMAEIEPMVLELGAALGDATELVSDVRERSGPWLERVDSVTLAAEETMITLGGLVRDKAPKVRQSLDHVEAVTRQAREQTMVQITEAVAKADAALSNVEATTKRLNVLVRGQGPVLERAIANAQLVTAQLKLAAIEIRRSPWRLLYKPDDKELETDNLYDAARSFALAAGTLDAAAESLRAVTGQPEVEADEIDRMVEHLAELFERFESAERQFWQALERVRGSSGGDVVPAGASSSVPVDAGP